MAKYSKAAGKKVETVMKEMEKGTLKTGSGKKVTDKKQAIAIGLSEAKKKGLKVPAKKAEPSKKSAEIKKAVAQKKLVPAKKNAAAKKAIPAKKAAAPKKTVPAKKSAPAKKAVAVKKPVAAKKAVAPKKTVVAKKAAPKVSNKKTAINKAVAVKEETTIPLQKNRTRPVTKKKTQSAPDPVAPEPPVEENSPMAAPVEEPTEVTPVTNESTGNHIPTDKYAVSRDTYHGRTKPTASKSRVKPVGKKPLWN